LRTDIFLSNGNFFNDIIRHAFGYTGKIEVTGSPRLDRLIKADAARREIIRKKIGVMDPGEKIVLYAPTFRGSGGDKDIPCTLNPAAITQALSKRFGGKFIFMKRLHPLAVSASAQLNRDALSGVRDMTAYPDIYELLEAVDVLITDYSNIMFEFSYTGRPVFLYAPDSNDYDKKRGLYFKYEALPFPISKSGGKLAENIASYDAAAYAMLAQRFYRSLDVREDGKASRRVALMILENMKQ